VMKRMDVLIFHFLINPPSDTFSEGGSTVSSHQPDSPRSRDGGADGQQTVLRDPINPNMPMLDDSMLFFTRGVLTFGTGMNLKMACTRWVGVGGGHLGVGGTASSQTCPLAGMEGRAGSRRCCETPSIPTCPCLITVCCSLHGAC
jgi:hypothetical protein